jgi:hypothetical protein
MDKAGAAASGFSFFGAGAACSACADWWSCATAERVRIKVGTMSPKAKWRIDDREDFKLLDPLTLIGFALPGKQMYGIKLVSNAGNMPQRMSLT